MSRATRERHITVPIDAQTNSKKSPTFSNVSVIQLGSVQKWSQRRTTSPTTCFYFVAKNVSSTSTTSLGTDPIVYKHAMFITTDDGGSFSLDPVATLVDTLFLYVSDAVTGRQSDMLTSPFYRTDWLWRCPHRSLAYILFTTIAIYDYGIECRMMQIYIYIYICFDDAVSQEVSTVS